MGRRLRGAALRAHKRGKAHASDIIDQKASDVEQGDVVQKSNEELFVVDTQGDSKAMVPPQLKQTPSKREAHKIKAQSKSSLSLLDQKRVEKLMDQHDAKELLAMVKEGHAKMTGNRRAVKRSLQKRGNRFDLWGAEEKTEGTKRVSAKQSLKTANAQAEKVLQIGGVKGEHVSLIAQPVSKTPTNAVKVDVAHSGQSYKPDPKLYQAVVQKAVSVELRREQAQTYARTPLATGMAPETRALLVGDSSSEEESGDENEEAVVLRKRRDKLTRAQRNKQKRSREERAMEGKQRRNKKLLNSISEIPRFKKEFKKEKKESADKAAAKFSHKKPTPGKDVLHRLSAKDPIHAPTLPVALQTDSSLRTIQPKGSLVTDRMASFADRNLVSKRKIGDKKRVVQGKRRRLNMKGGKGHEIAKDMANALKG